MATEVIDCPPGIVSLGDIVVYGKRLYPHRYTLPLGGDACRQCNHLYYNIVNGDARRDIWTVGDGLVPYLYMAPRLFYKGCIVCKEGLDLRPSLCHVPLTVSVKEVMDSPAYHSDAGMA